MGLWVCGCVGGARRGGVGRRCLFVPRMALLERDSLGPEVGIIGTGLTGSISARIFKQGAEVEAWSGG